jgi:hypothetical protein
MISLDPNPVTPNVMKSVRIDGVRLSEEQNYCQTGMQLEF